MAYQKTYQMPTNKKCLFCKTKVVDIDYKDVNVLQKYLNRWNKIDPANRNGNCAKHQRKMVKAIKRARHLALLPFVIK